MSSHQHVPRLTPATRMSLWLLMVVALVAGQPGHALTIVTYDGSRFELSDERAAMHSPLFLQLVVNYHRLLRPIHRDGAVLYLPEKPLIGSWELRLLLQFIMERDLDVDHACQWVRIELAERRHCTDRQIRFLLSAADHLIMHLFIIAVGITLPLPTTRMPALPSVNELRTSQGSHTVVSTLESTTVLAGEVDHDDNECLICGVAYNGQVMTFRYLSCGGAERRHRFHMDCIDRCLANSATCPICRAGVITQRRSTVLVASAQGDFEIPKNLAAEVVRIWRQA